MANLPALKEILDEKAGCPFDASLSPGTQLPAHTQGVSFGFPLPFPFLFYNFGPTYSAPAYYGGYYPRASTYYASIHDRIVSASLILHRLGSYARQNSVHQALAEIGRVHKTIHILRTLDDEEYRRRMGRELNKGEASHDLSRFLCFGKEGALRGREFGDQIHTFSCLSVLHNAVVAWNTLHIGSIVGQLRAEGQVIDDDILGLTTPLFRKHLNLFGKYHFDLERMRQTEGGPEQGIA
jgi:hypothetical protein